jgi:hypothetical protein
MTIPSYGISNVLYFGGGILDLWWRRGLVLVVSISRIVLVGQLMTHKYRGCIVVLSINKSVEPNEEQKVLTSGFDQGFTVNTSKQVFRGIWQYK